MELTDIIPTDPLTLPHIFDYPNSKRINTKPIPQPTNPGTTINPYPIRSTFMLYLILITIIPLSCFVIKNYYINSILTLSKNVPKISQTINAGKPILATLNNTQNGYSFNYPYNYIVTNTDDGISLAPPNGKGKILVSVKNQTIKIGIISSDLSPDETSSLTNSAQTIKASFITTHPVAYTDDQLKQRFEKTKDLPVN